MMVGILERSTTGWGILWRSEGNFGGKQEYLLGVYGNWYEEIPARYQGYRIAVFATRREAREHVKNEYGYIKDRPDLLSEPHRWKVPKVVKVKVTVEVNDG